MDELTILDKMQNTILWTIIGSVIVLLVLVLTMLGKLIFCPVEDKVHTEIVHVDNHKYIIFYDADNEVKYIEHSPECDCFTIEYD